MALFGLLGVRGLVLIRSAWLLSLAYLLVRSPQKIYFNIYILALGASLRGDSIPRPSDNDGFLATVLTLLALEDLARLGSPLPADSLLEILPLRLLLLLAASTSSYGLLLAWQPLANGPTFAFLFIDTVLNMWLFLAAREQRNEHNKRLIKNSRGIVDADN